MKESTFIDYFNRPFSSLPSLPPPIKMYTLHMFMTTAAPPNKAAAPIAPVFIGMAPPELVLEAAEAEVAALFAAPPPAVLMLDVGVGTPEVNGALLAELAPEKAGLPLVWLGLAVAVLLAGLSILSMT